MSHREIKYLDSSKAEVLPNKCNQKFREVREFRTCYWNDRPQDTKLNKKGSEENRGGMDLEKVKRSVLLWLWPKF